MYRHSGTALLQCQRNAGHDGPHRWISGDDRHEWTTAPPRLLDCGLCFEEDGKEVHPHPECRLAKQAPEEPEAAPPPRPPYAVAYSVGGQLFESWLPGDATAVAQDGVLIIQHSGPVAGIVRVSPVKEG
jgi:hypothetical protein